METDADLPHAAAKFSFNDEDTEELCRICREGSDVAPLMTPCYCSGSVALVHNKCLEEWLKISKKESCELCKFTYRFDPLFMPGAPSRLSASDIIVAIAKWIMRATPHAAAVSIAAILWVGCLPIITSWIYRASIHLASFTEDVMSLRLSRWDLLWQDWYCGAVILVFLVVCVVVNTGVGEFMVKEVNRQDRRWKRLLVAAEMRANRQAGDAARNNPDTTGKSQFLLAFIASIFGFDVMDWMTRVGWSPRTQAFVLVLGNWAAVSTVTYFGLTASLHQLMTPGTSIVRNITFTAIAAGAFTSSLMVYLKHANRARAGADGLEALQHTLNSLTAAITAALATSVALLSIAYVVCTAAVLQADTVAEWCVLLDPSLPFRLAAAQSSQNDTLTQQNAESNLENYFRHASDTLTEAVLTQENATEAILASAAQAVGVPAAVDNNELVAAFALDLFCAATVCCFLLAGMRAVTPARVVRAQRGQAEPREREMQRMGEAEGARPQMELPANDAGMPDNVREVLNDADADDVEAIMGAMQEDQLNDGAVIDWHELLGLRGFPLIVHFIVGVALVSVGTFLFIALPIMSARSGKSFVRKSRWTLLIWELSGVTTAWDDANETVAVIKADDIICLVQGYAAILLMLVIISLVNVVTKWLICAVVWCRRRAPVPSGSRLLRAVDNLGRTAFADYSVLIEGILNKAEVPGMLERTHQGRVSVVLARISAMLLMKLVVQPTFAGILLDLFSLPLFDSSVDDRIAWHFHNAIASYLVHWVIGLSTLVVMNAVVLQLREVLRYDLLARWTAPVPKSQGTLRRIIDIPLRRQFRSICLLSVITLFVTICFVYLPAIFLRHSGLQIAAGRPVCHRQASQVESTLLFAEYASHKYHMIRHGDVNRATVTVMGMACADATSWHSAGNLSSRWCTAGSAAAMRLYVSMQSRPMLGYTTSNILGWDTQSHKEGLEPFLPGKQSLFTPATTSTPHSPSEDAKEESAILDDSVFVTYAKMLLWALQEVLAYFVRFLAFAFDAGNAVVLSMASLRTSYSAGAVNASATDMVYVSPLSTQFFNVTVYETSPEWLLLFPLVARYLDTLPTPLNASLPISNSEKVPLYRMLPDDKYLFQANSSIDASAWDGLLLRTMPVLLMESYVSLAGGRSMVGSSNETDGQAHLHWSRLRHEGFVNVNAKTNPDENSTELASNFTQSSDGVESVTEWFSNYTEPRKSVAPSGFVSHHYHHRFVSRSHDSNSTLHTPGSIVRSGPKKGLKACRLLNLTTDEFMTDVVARDSGKDGHSSAPEGNSTEGAKEPDNSGSVYRAYQLDGARVLDCGETVPPSVSLALMLPPPDSQLLQYLPVGNGRFVTNVWQAPEPCAPNPVYVPFHLLARDILAWTQEFFPWLYELRALHPEVIDHPVVAALLTLLVKPAKFIRMLVPEDVRLAYSYLPWHLLVDVVLVHIAIMLTLEVARAFAWLMQSTWMSFMSKSFGIAHLVMPPTEQIDLAVRFVETGAPSSLQRISLLPTPSRTSMERFHHIDGTPGVGIRAIIDDRVAAGQWRGVRRPRRAARAGAGEVLLPAFGPDEGADEDTSDVPETIREQLPFALRNLLEDRPDASTREILVALEHAISQDALHHWPDLQLADDDECLRVQEEALMRFRLTAFGDGFEQSFAQSRLRLLRHISTYHRAHHDMVDSRFCLHAVGCLLQLNVSSRGLRGLALQRPPTGSVGTGMQRGKDMFHWKIYCDDLSTQLQQQLLVDHVMSNMRVGDVVKLRNQMNPLGGSFAGILVRTMMPAPSWAPLYQNIQHGQPLPSALLQDLVLLIDADINLRDLWSAKPSRVIDTVEGPPLQCRHCYGTSDEVCMLSPCADGYVCTDCSHLESGTHYTLKEAMPSVYVTVTPSVVPPATTSDRSQRRPIARGCCRLVYSIPAVTLGTVLSVLLVGAVTIVCLCSGLQLGRATMAALGTTGWFTHDPYALGLGMYMLFFFADVLFVAYYAMVNAIGGAVRGVAARLLGLAVQTTESWSAFHRKAVYRLRVPDVADVPIDAELPLVDVVLGLFPSVAGAGLAKRVVHKLVRGLTRSGLWIGLRIWRHATRINFHLGNVGRVPVVMTWRRGMSLMGMAAAILVVLPLLVGGFWTLVTDPLRAWQSTTLGARSRLQFEVSSHPRGNESLIYSTVPCSARVDGTLVPLASLVDSLEISSFVHKPGQLALLPVGLSIPALSLFPGTGCEFVSAATPLIRTTGTGSWLSFWGVGALLLYVLCELAARGFMGASRRAAMDMMEWRFMMVFTTRMWHQHVYPNCKRAIILFVLAVVYTVACSLVCSFAIQSQLLRHGSDVMVVRHAFEHYSLVSQTADGAWVANIHALRVAAHWVTSVFNGIMLIVAVLGFIQSPSELRGKLFAAVSRWHDELYKHRYLVGRALRNLTAFERLHKPAQP